MRQRDPSIGAILRESLAVAPRTVRRSSLFALIAWLAMMALQAVDSRRKTGPGGMIEFLSALCGSAGGILLALTGILGSSGDRRVLLTLPAIGVLSAGLLSAAVALMIVRGLLGSEPAFVAGITTMYLALLWFAASTVMRAARALYAHAQAETEAAARARMNPHFLFNSLNTVASLVRSDPVTAERVTENLAGVLRMTLDRSNAPTIAIADEVAYLKAWLAVEQARWGDRLRVKWDVTPGVEALSIPPLLLQPLIENALRHGLGGRIEGGTVDISIRREGPDVLMRVADDGVGFPDTHVERTGLGALRARLDVLFAGRASLVIDPLTRGTAITVRVPAS